MTHIRINQLSVIHFIFIIVICSSCIINSKEDSFGKIMPIPLKEMNHELTLSYPVMEKGEYIPKQSDFLTLEAYNNSKEMIIFPSDYGLRIYIYQNDIEQWNEIKNLVKYYPVGNPQLSPKGNDHFGQILISSYPDIPVGSKPVEIRVVVIGTIYHDGLPTNKQVGAYMDVTLQP